MKNKKAFTIVELLVVISIITLLIALLLPALAAARQQAQQTVCMSRMRQTGLASTMYMDDWKGHSMPVAGQGIAYAEIMWPSYLGYYFGDSSVEFLYKVTSCPSLLEPSATPNIYNVLGMRSWDPEYKFPYFRPIDGNTYMLWSVRDSQITEPSNFMFVMDSAYNTPSPKQRSFMHVNLNPGTGYIAAPLPHHRHSGDANILFNDGHVSSFDIRDWMEDGPLFQSHGVVRDLQGNYVDTR